ncbi:acyl-CoA dehydrogenase, partial [Thermodesulfobacteriota bacterium]
KLIEVFGTEKQKKLFLERMYSGQWGGTMLLTEPEAGSDVGALTTSAMENPDGTYSIKGTKIFISAGEQDMTENIIHPVLARIEGAPAGTKGISLFIVPKIWVNDDESPGEMNDVTCERIEEKLGIHGSATCSLTLGGKGTCRGLLLGEENKGMRAMFYMMNEARLGVGLQAFAMASAAYIHAVNYTRQRTQGRHLLSSDDPSAPPVSIVGHPDVRRMLMWMKAHVEGMRSFIYFVGLCFDRTRIAESEEERARYEGLIELLTPVVKAYCSDKAFEVCTTAVQVYGGYGYTNEYPVEQLLRDCKITSIYEGTNGIQAIDLLARKLPRENGKTFMGLIEEMKATVRSAKSTPGLEDLAGSVEVAVDRLGEVAISLGEAAMSPQVLAAFSHAYLFLDIVGDVILAWMLLWRASVAAPKLEKRTGPADEPSRTEKVTPGKDATYYDGQVRTARYYILSVLPATLGKMDALENMDDSIVEMAEASFAG